MSVLDLKDAFHSLRLTENSERYCGILPYFGSASYLYQRMPMGLSISPAIWQSYINAILDCLQSMKYCEAIMVDLLFTPKKTSHFAKLEDLLKALCKTGLKISPKKCQLFKTDLQYMGNTIFIRGKRVCVNYKEPQFCIYQTRKEDFNYTLMPANLPLVVHCIKFRMASQSSFPMQVKECERQQRITRTPLIRLQFSKCLDYSNQLSKSTLPLICSNTKWNYKSDEVVLIIRRSVRQKFAYM